MKNYQLRKQLITRETFTWEDLIRICRAEEQCNEQSSTLGNKDRINFIRNKKPYKNSKPIKEENVDTGRRVLWPMFLLNYKKQNISY